MLHQSAYHAVLGIVLCGKLYFVYYQLVLSIIVASLFSILFP